MIALIIALLWVLFFNEIKLLKLRSGIGLKIILIKKTKLKSFKDFWHKFCYDSIKLHNFSFQCHKSICFSIYEI